MQELESKPFFEHLEDLRGMLIKCALALGAGMVVCFCFAAPLLEILYKPLRWAGQEPKAFLRVLGIVDPFSIQMQVSFLGGTILALPLILFFVGKFILPALTWKEKRYLFPAFGTGTILFLGGVAFCYWLILPPTLQFFLDYNKEFGFQPEWTIQNYLEFTVQMLLAFGLCFELPLVIMILHVMGVVSCAMLNSSRRYAILIIVIAAACITPTSDVVSLSLLGVPMYLLFELCVVLAWWRERSSRKAGIPA